MSEPERRAPVYTAVLQILDWVQRDRLHYFVIFALFVWSYGLLNYLLSKFYRPYTMPYDDTKAVIVPTAFEETGPFIRALRSYFLNEPWDVTPEGFEPLTPSMLPDEICVVFNGIKPKDEAALARQLAELEALGFQPAYPGLYLEDVEEIRHRVVAAHAAGLFADPVDEACLVPSSGVHSVPTMVDDDGSVIYQGIVLLYAVMRSAGKRPAILRGLELTRGSIVVLGDSDTFWFNDTLAELMKPFADPRVGGVTTDQRIYNPEMYSLKNILVRFADQLEDMRGRVSMAAMSAVFGTVGCLPGRTIAFRRVIFANIRRSYIGRYFLGIIQRISDDREATNRTLMHPIHKRTVYQRTARVMTDAPSNFFKWWKQQLRWARGSQYYTLKMLPFYFTGRTEWTDWKTYLLPRPSAIRTWYLGFRFLMDILVPFWWVGTVVNMAWKIFVEDPVSYSLGSWWRQVILVSSGVLISALLRNMPHLRNNPRDILFLPIYVIILSFLLTPIRIRGFFTMARTIGWGTRAVKYDERARFNHLALIPPTIGTLLLAAFSAAGPFLETPELFKAFVGQYWQLIVLAGVGLIFFQGVVPEIMSALRVWRATRKRPPSVGDPDDPDAIGGTTVAITQ